jgi:hypothetical protein
MKDNTGFLAGLVGASVLAPFTNRNVTWEQLKTPVELCTRHLIDILTDDVLQGLATDADLQLLGLEGEDDLFREEIQLYFGTTFPEAVDPQREFIIAWRVLVNATSERICATRGNIFD